MVKNLNKSNSIRKIFDTGGSVGALKYLKLI